MAERLQQAQDEIEDLKVQREYLIDKVVISQRLALARCRFSYQFAVEKAWNGLVDNARHAANSDGVNGLQGSIQKISDTKEYM